MLKNQAIEQFIRDKTALKTPWQESDIAYINQYTGYGGEWEMPGLPKERALYEYYTPIEVVEKMVGLSKKHGYSGGPVLEPSCGIGRFLHYFEPSEEVTGIEMDESSMLIARVNFPAYTILHQRFNEVFTDRSGKAQAWLPKYRLVIGNPPYGPFEGRFTAGEKSITHAETYVDYFIARSIDLLLPGGLLVFIIPSAWLDGQETKAKAQILTQADLIDAYRLPVGTFSQTDIGTDIIVFKKKSFN